MGKFQFTSDYFGWWCFPRFCWFCIRWQIPFWLISFGSNNGQWYSNTRTSKCGIHWSHQILQSIFHCSCKIICAKIAARICGGFIYRSNKIFFKQSILLGKFFMYLNFSTFLLRPIICKITGQLYYFSQFLFYIPSHDSFIIVIFCSIKCSTIFLERFFTFITLLENFN